jgi:hypothetical protein
MHKTELKKLKVGDKVRVFLLNQPHGCAAKVVKKTGFGIELEYLEDNWKGHYIRHYTFDIIDKIQNGGLNPFIEREENGIERANRVRREQR